MAVWGRCGLNGRFNNFGNSNDGINGQGNGNWNSGCGANGNLNGNFNRGFGNIGGRGNNRGARRDNDGELMFTQNLKKHLRSFVFLKAIYGPKIEHLW